MKRKEERKSRTTWEAEESLRETAQEKRKDELFEESLKRAQNDNASANVGLTCTEANADSILSEGESV